MYEEGSNDHKRSPLTWWGVSEQRALPGTGSWLGEKPLECMGSPWTQEGETTKGKEGQGSCEELRLC